MGFDDIGVTEALRGLRAPEPGAVERGGDARIGPGPLERIGERHRRKYAWRMPERLDHPVDSCGRHERPHGVVDQDLVGSVRCERGEAIADRGLPRGAPFGGAEQPVAFQAGDRGRIERGIAGPDHDQDQVDAGVIQEHAERAGQHRDSTDPSVLFRQRGGGPGAATGGNDECGGGQGLQTFAKYGWALA
jgi:hypothetical protein